MAHRGYRVRVSQALAYEQKLEEIERKRVREIHQAEVRRAHCVGSCSDISTGMRNFDIYVLG